ncbi:MAG: hypothetical protein ACK4K7_01860 [Allosphingosinicella sp.]|uniref:hypothetical protein n=1 Tax=Allosphingosinicella sp. TaxID=2823234 RepID=UPI003929C06B
MKHLLTAAAAAALTAGCAMYAPAEPTPEAQNRLAEALQGRTAAGPPQNCVRAADLRGNRSVDERTIIFDGVAGTVYVNQPRDGCPLIGPSRAIRTRTTGTQLCAGDIVSVFDPQTGMEYGSCALGEFTTYRRN